MDLYINNEKIDYKLETETRLSEVADGLFKWADAESVHILEIKYDGNTYSPQVQENRDYSLKNIERIDVSVKNIADIHQENLQLLHQYITLFIKSIEGLNLKLITDLKNEANPISQLLSDFLEEHNFNIDKVDHSTITGNLLLNIRALDPEKIDDNPALLNSLLQQLKTLKIILNDRISELSDPVGELTKTVDSLKKSFDEINEISILLQSGKDKEALNRIIKFSELSQKTLRLYPILKMSGVFDVNNIQIDNMSVADYYNELNGVLNELVEAFSASDSVLIGDLLEYEVAPRLDSLINALELVTKEQQE